MNAAVVYFNCDEAGRFLGKNGKPAHRATVHRYIEHGVKVRGSIVRLRAQRMAWGWGITRADIDRFLADLNHAYGNTPRGVVTPTWRDAPGVTRAPRTPRVSKDEVGTYEDDPIKNKPSGRARQRAGRADPAGRA